MPDITESQTVELIEEVADVGVRDVVTGRVRVETRVKQFEELARMELQSDVVEVSHVPIGRAIVGDVPQTRVEGDLTIIPIFEEIMVVEKRLVLKEEIHIRRHQKAETVEIPVTLRRETADIRRLGPAQG
ncbi:YsnF/AvaK domain-containing protein [Lichenifustis flavocetrariae]|uniref:YsnF/AvaK domain-containing protein n=1 Tax=Lichenifustis flavocetrariae TaxID=2949735 RepID=A0AA42CIK1_9HYPH|nr:DUF2382 domain-containing protein [Lichenifustis flavocetrariae]MCW6508658.1 YsnF/AvaK domain-containing protein [Lichenifustis flavocetrariae]